MIRLGGPNFAQIPVNRPICPVHNNQQDGYMRMENPKGRVNYEPNSLGGGCPMQSPDRMKAFISHAQTIGGPKVRERSPSFSDHYSQATLFWNSQTDTEKQHIVEAAHFELGKVETMAIRERMIDHFNKIDHELACRVARGIGVAEPKAAGSNHGRSSSALSMEKTTRKTSATRKVAILCAAGVDGSSVKSIQAALKAANVDSKIVSKYSGELAAADGSKLKPDKMFVTTASVEYDAIVVPGGRESVQALAENGDAIHFLNEAYRHCKPIAAVGEGAELLQRTQIRGLPQEQAAAAEKGIVLGREANEDFSRRLVEALSRHRFWNRESKDAVPA